jgi:signal transduction histidine kinase
MNFKTKQYTGVVPYRLMLRIMFFWSIYTFVYSILKCNPNTALLAGYFSLIGETGLDIFLTIITLRLWRKTIGSKNTNIFLIFSSAYIAAIFADGIYNIVLNLYEFQYVNPITISMFELPFSLFLLLQIIAWAYVLYLNKADSLIVHKTIYVPYLLVSTLLFIMFMFGVEWHIQYLSTKGIFQTIDTIFEVAGFTMATICLARAQTFLIRFTSIGYLLIVASDFIIRYHVISGDVPYLSPLESTWILGLIFMSIGFFYSSEKYDEKLLKLSSINSLQSQIGIWLIILWLISVFMFASTYYFLSPGKDLYLNYISQNFLSMLVPFSVLAIISSNYISMKISLPLSKLEHKINEFLLTEAPPENSTNRSDHDYISEFKALDKFVFDSFILYQKKHLADMNFSKLAAQVTHDIRSPLAAINTAIFNETTIPENKRIMIRNAVKRINDIANNLLSQSKNNAIVSLNNVTKIDQPELILVMLDNIISEKRYEYYQTNININLKIEKSSSYCFSQVNPGPFKRILSNLINNSIEAINSNGTITISLSCNATHVKITIVDNGCGIPPDILPKVTEQGFSFNKINGTGFGLSYTQHYLNQINGTLQVQSEEKIGTEITINLARSSPPSWFCNVINIKYNSIIVVLDDDRSIHDAWDVRLATIPHIKLVHAYNVYQLLKLKINPQQPILYLIDYELLSDIKNGLDVIEELKLNENSILVTSCFEDHAIRNRCETLSVTMIPKPYVPYIKIITIPSTKSSGVSTSVYFDQV